MLKIHVLIAATSLVIMAGDAIAADRNVNSALKLMATAPSNTNPDLAGVTTNFRYQTGAYFYGADCGGNSLMTSKIGRPRNAKSGVILSGGSGRGIEEILNCGDRRHALASYREAFEGNVGQPYNWLDPDNAATGTVTALGKYRRDGFECVSFGAVTMVAPPLSSSTGTACRLQDGNWHTQ